MPEAATGPRAVSSGPDARLCRGRGHHPGQALAAAPPAAAERGECERRHGGMAPPLRGPRSGLNPGRPGAGRTARPGGAVTPARRAVAGASLSPPEAAAAEQPAVAPGASALWCRVTCLTCPGLAGSRGVTRRTAADSESRVPGLGVACSAPPEATQWRHFTIDQTRTLAVLASMLPPRVTEPPLHTRCCGPTKR